jgi:3(or 17)beta-hydroxysteroid dehydrogenase
VFPNDFRKEAHMRLAGKSALVTGAASGIGRAIAGAFAREGARVLVADVLDEEGEAVAREIVERKGVAVFQHLDVSSDDQWKAALEEFLRKFGSMHILVNNAGLSGTSYKDIFDETGWQRLIDVNAHGVFLGIKHATKAMRSAGGGSIVNVSSISAMIGQAGVHFAYNASKAAIHLLSKSTAVEFGREKIRCNSVHPGMLPPMRTSGSSADPIFRKKLLDRIPLGRPGEVDEVANAVLFLASDEASYVTGTELCVDGGYLAC